MKGASSAARSRVTGSGMGEGRAEALLACRQLEAEGLRREVLVEGDLEHLGAPQGQVVQKARHPQQHAALEVEDELVLVGAGAEAEEHEGPLVVTTPRLPLYEQRGSPGGFDLADGLESQRGQHVGQLSSESACSPTPLWWFGSPSFVLAP